MQALTKRILLGLGLAAALVSLLEFEWRPSPPAPSKPQRHWRQFFEGEIAPILSRVNSSNQQAVANARLEVADLFQKYDAGVPAFAEDLTQLSVRLSLIKRQLADHRRHEDRAADLVRERFESRVVSETQLEFDLRRVVVQFNYDLAANCNWARIQIEAEAEARGLPPRIAQRGAAIFHQQLNAATARLPEQTLAKGLAECLASTGAMIGAQGAIDELIAQSAAPLAETASAETALAAGDMGVGFAAGGGAGSAVEPGGGTLLGAIIGAGAGAAIDVWLTHRERQEIAREARDFLMKTETLILNGPRGTNGLRQQMQATAEDCNDALERSYRQAVRQQMIQDENS